LISALFLCAFFQVNDAIAQRRGDKEKPKREKRENQKPSKKEADKGQSEDVQVFDKTDDYEYFEKKSSNNPKNIFKINPFDALDGSFPLFFERVLTNKFSAEIGIGVTTTSESFTSIRKELFGSDFYEGFHQGQTGTFLKLGVRYYAGKNDDAPEGSYLALEYQTKNFQFDAYPYIKDGSNFYRAATGPYQDTKVTNTDLIRVIFGYQSDNSSNFCWDPYIGIAMRKRTFDGWYEDESGKPILGSISETKPIFLIGAKLGIRF
jgi:hypothetical protein